MQEFSLIKRLNLSTKILLASMAAFVVVYFAVISVTPFFVYGLVSQDEARKSMSFNEQVGMRIEQRFDELVRFSSVVAMDEELRSSIRSCASDPTPASEAGLRLALSEMIQKDGVSSYHVLGIYIETEREDGTRFQTETVGFPESARRYLQDTVLPEYRAEGVDTGFLKPFEYSPEDTMSYWGSMFTRGYGYVRPYGSRGQVVIISSYDDITLIAEDLAESCTDSLLLAGREVIPPYSKKGLIDQEQILDHMIRGDSYQEQYLVEEDGIYAARRIGSTSWRLVTWLDRQEVLRRNRNQTWMILLTVGIFGLLLAAAVFLIVTRFTRPLKEVSNRMHLIAGGDFSARVEVTSSDEIGQVSRSFNVMAEQLEEKIEAIVEKEKREESMKYSLLISQVDPHFLYNTMNMITYLAQKGRNEDIVVVNRAMIEILRDRLRIEISQVFDTVEQEISVIRQYVIIQEYRYEGIFRVKYEIEEAVREQLILKNILQPLVENALSHGILENRDENGEPLGGLIVISAAMDGNDRIVLSVRDNGAGMTEEQLEKLLDENTVWERGRHIGIRNIRQRLQYIYHTDVDFRIESREEEGTTVTISLPVRIMDQESEHGELGVVPPMV